MDNVCTVCGKCITVQIFKGSGICSEDCRKNRDNDHVPFDAARHYPPKAEISDRWYQR